MLVTLLVKFRNKDCKTTELGLLLQVLPVRIVTFVETLGSHLKRYSRIYSLLDTYGTKSTVLSLPSAQEKGNTSLPKTTWISRPVLVRWKSRVLDHLWHHTKAVSPKCCKKRSHSLNTAVCESSAHAESTIARVDTGHLSLDLDNGTKLNAHHSLDL